jgi:hypothetical protein
MIQQRLCTQLNTDHANSYALIQGGQSVSVCVCLCLCVIVRVYVCVCVYVSV